MQTWQAWPHSSNVGAHANLGHIYPNDARAQQPRVKEHVSGGRTARTASSDSHGSELPCDDFLQRVDLQSRLITYLLIFAGSGRRPEPVGGQLTGEHQRCLVSCFSQARYHVAKLSWSGASHVSTIKHDKPPKLQRVTNRRVGILRLKVGVSFKQLQVIFSIRL